jgi:uncharacterized membrane protein YdjX (TVP38/TMEM64 family)
LTLKGGGRHGAAMSDAEAPSRKGLLIKITLLGVIAIAAAVLVLLGLDVKALVVRGMALIGSAGPWVFFTGMALLPAVGCPLLLFALPAGPAFSERLGLGGVLAAYGAAIAVNLLLTYWIGRFALRPWIERLVTRAGYTIPQFDKDEQLEVTLLLRITPGPPFFLQSYLLGLGNVSFLTYIWVSWSIAMAYGVGFVVFGDAIIHGRAGAALTGLSLFIAAVIITHLIRKHFGKGRGRTNR